MSCSCNCNPCTCDSECNPDAEPLSSALNNFITEFFGSLTKSCVNNQVTWNLPCDLAGGNSAFPRNAGEGLACYFLRYIQEQINTSQAGNLYGSFYALMPPDNPNIIPPGGAIAFPRDGPANGIVRLSSSAFYLPTISNYEIEWHALQNSTPGPTGMGQTQLRLNGVAVVQSTTRQNNSVMLTTTVVNSVVEVINPSGNTDSLIIVGPPGGGGNTTQGASLTIKRL